MARLATVVSPTSLTTVADSLNSLPEKTKESYTLKEAVATLADAIHAALEKGYSHADIAVILHDHGIPISPASLKAYLPLKGQPKRRTRRPRKTETPLTIEATSTPELIPASVEVAPAEEAPKKRRGRQPGTKTAAAKPAAQASTKAPTKTATKTAAKSKAAPRTTASKSRGRKKQA